MSLLLGSVLAVSQIKVNFQDAHQLRKKKMAKRASGVILGVD